MNDPGRWQRFNRRGDVTLASFADNDEGKADGVRALEHDSLRVGEEMANVYLKGNPHQYGRGFSLVRGPRAITYPRGDYPMIRVQWVFGMIHARVQSVQP